MDRAVVVGSIKERWTQGLELFLVRTQDLCDSGDDLQLNEPQTP